MRATMDGNNSNSPNTRIERKRAHDREAQRASRAKTKAYIAHLEQTVAELSENSGDSRANYLARHVSKQAQDLEAMQALVQKIRTLVQDGAKPEQSIPRITNLDDDRDSSPGEDPIRDIVTRTHFSRPSTDANDDGVYDGSHAAARFPSGTGQSNASEKQPVPAVSTCHTRKLAEFGDSLVCDENDPHYFRRLDNAISHVERTADHLSGRDEDEDILIRAIVDGWETTAQTHHLDVAWRLFREADETLWHRIGPMDRLAHFWQMRSTMLNKIQPKGQERRETPSFMTPTLVQRTNPTHPAVADYFAWPHVRDNVINTGLNQVSGRQTIAFAESFRFIWPYELRDMYKKNTSTGFYSFSEGFLRSFHNLACYRILQSGDATDIPLRLNPQLTWKGDDRVIEYKSPEEHQSDSSPETLLGNEPVLAVPPPMMPNEPSPDWLSPMGLDLMADPRFMNFAMDPLAMPPEASLAQWPGI